MELINNIQNLSFYVQALLGILIIIYTVFSFLIVRQTALLNRGFGTMVSGMLKAFAWGHFLASALLLTFVVFTLLF